MSSRTRTAVALATALAALAAAALAPGATAAPRAFYGTITQTPLTDKDFDRMERAKLGTLRFEIDWASVANEDGSFSWGGPDALVERAARHRLRPLATLFGTPAYVARKLDGYGCKGDRCRRYLPRSKAALGEWREFVRAAAGRYGRGGEFWADNPGLPRAPIRDWQIYNEQNSPDFARPKPNVRRYFKLLEGARRTLDGVDHRADVVTGGMYATPLGGRKPAITASRFIERLYGIRGARKVIDGIGVHPYAAKVSRVRGQVDEIRDAVRAGGDGNAGLFVTELGWASGGPENPLVVGKSGQAARLRDAYRMFERMRGAWNVKTVVWFSWRDSATSVCAWCAKSGLVSRNLRAKRSLQAMTRLTGGR